MKLLRLFFLLVAIFYGLSTQANHMLGGNITWDCAGPGQYAITLTIYKDCYGTPGDPASESIVFYPSGCGAVPFSANMNFVSATQISNLCPSEFANSSCNTGGFQPGTSQVIYTVTVSLAAGCQWQAIYNSGDWNYFNNMNAIPQNAFIQTVINTAQPCTNSPDITSTPANPQIPYICLNQPFSLTLPLTNPAGYTYTYALGNCQTTGATINNPITASGYVAPAGLTLTGNTINWTPGTLGNYAICISITVNSGANYIGTVTENMAFIVRNCAPTVTSFSVPNVTSVGSSTTVSGNNLTVCAGDSLYFTVQANNPVLTRTITLSNSATPGLPLTFTQTGTNPALGTYSLLATGAMISGSPYTLDIYAVDDACPTPGRDTITVNITVSPNVSILTNDTTICFGQSVTVAATGLTNNNYTWTVLTGGDNAPPPVNSVASQSVTPDFTTSYRISAAGIPPSCRSADTVTVSVAMTGLTLAATSETCNNNNGAIDLSVLGSGSGNYTYAWVGTNVINGQQDQINLHGGLGQNYSVTVTDNVYGCILNASTNIADNPQPAIVFTSDTTICAGGAANMTIDFTAGVAPFDVTFTANPIANAPANVTNVPDPYTFSVNPAQTTTYTVVNVTDATGCAAVINASRTVTVRQPVTSVFLPHANICVGDNLTLQMDHSSAGSYSVVYSINTVNQAPAVVVADLGFLDVPDPVTPGTYTYDIETVSYNDAPLPTCPSNDAANPFVQVVVRAIPTVALSGPATICAGNCHNFTLTLTGSGPWTVNYTRGGVAQPALVIPDAATPYNYIWNVCPAATANYCITSVQDANCTAPVAGVCSLITVAPMPVVNYSITNTELCTGGCSSVNVTVAPAGTFTISFSETPADPNIGISPNQNSPYNQAICPLTTTSYCLDSVYFTGVPQCASVLNQCISVNVNGNIAVAVDDTICNNIGTQYQMVYVVSGGEMPYDELPAGANGTFNGAGTVFTTNFVNSGSAGGPWVFSDVNDCNSISMSMPAYTCPVLSNSGTMVLTPQSRCGLGALTGTWNNNGFLDGNDEQMFILHTTANNTLGTVIATDCDDAGFGDADSPLAFGAAAANGVIVSGTTYYISSVVGDAGPGAGGCVNTAAPNVQISPGVPVVWNVYPVVNYSVNDTELCAGDCATLMATVSPANTFTISFSESPPDPVLGTAIGQNSPFNYIVCPNVTTSYCLDSVYFTGAPQCATVLNQCISVNVNGNIAVVPADTICNNISTQYQVVYQVSGGAMPYTENPAGANGTFNGAGTLFTTALINSGSGAGPWTFNDVNSCNIVNVSMNPYSCPIITQAGTMSNQLLTVCGGTVIPNTATGVFNSNAVLDGNDEQMFVLHTGAGNTLGTVIATDCNDSVFGDADSPLAFGATGAGVVTSGTTYYISSVAGDAGVGPGGCVNTAAPNVQISVGQPVTFFQAATATLSAVAATEACQGQSVALQVVLTGQGPWTIIHTINGIAQPETEIPLGGSPYIFNVSASGTYCLLQVNNSPASCPGTVSGCVVVLIHPLPTATFSASAATCAGTNHCFDITFTGETPWNFTIDDTDAIDEVIPATATNPYQYCVGAAGPYRITSITDGFGCTNTVASPTVNLTVNALPTIQWTFGDTTFCQGSCIDLTMASTGAATFDVNITSPDPNITSATLQNIAAVHMVNACQPGSYAIQNVTDNNGCVSAAGATIQVDEIPTPTVNAGPDLDQCVGLPTVLGTPGVVGQTYNWTPTTGMAAGQAATAQPTTTINTQGTYNFTVTATVGQCAASDLMTLVVHALPIVVLTPVETSICFEACTDINAAGADSYVWNATPSINGALNTPSVNVCPSVTETFTATGTQIHNAIQCQSSASVQITVGVALNVVVDFSAEVCFQTCDGFANFTISNGFPPYLVNGAASINWTNLCAGDHDYEVTDAEGCVFTGTFTINERPAEVIDVITPTNPTCFGDATGSIDFTDAGASSFTLTAPGIPSMTDNTAPFEFNNLPAGNYIIGMTVPVGPGISCEATQPITLTSVSPEMTILLPWTSQSFCYGDEVCFEANLNGGTGVLTTHWNTCPSANACEISTLNPFCLTITQDSTLYVYGTDINNCPTETLAVTASLFPSIGLSFSSAIDTVICQYECTDLSVELTGGNGNTSVQWYQIPIDNTPFANGNTVNVCPFASTDFWVEASDGCSANVRDTIHVTVHETPTPYFEVDTLAGCFPATIYFYDLSAPITESYTCQWSMGNGTNINFCGDTSYAYPGYGTFFPSLTITSVYGCSASDTLDSQIVIYGFPEIDFTWEPQPVTVLEHQVQFTNLTTGAVSYNWSFYLTGNSPLANPSWNFPDLDNASFPVCLEATSQFGCVDTVCHDIFIESILQVFIPNTFTPDGDGINDVFLPSISGVKPGTFKLWILNRWGDEMYFSDDPEKAWTGGVDKGEYYVEDGTYLWRIECVSLSQNKVEVFEGHVNILR